SHVRFGLFVLFFFRRVPLLVLLLAVFVFRLLWPLLLVVAVLFLLWFRVFVLRSALSFARWLSVGFALGVLFTGFMSFLGLSFV
ncbi:protein adenylyltransferase SelO family protein, partial [Klebsiella pneumoniae]|uniref:protein adenylyltransferase SelO family protein n=1 Tax=Klebsiella pneumoniae TaxID=573 RepID=UPI003B594CCF